MNSKNKNVINFNDYKKKKTKESKPDRKPFQIQPDLFYSKSFWIGVFILAVVVVFIYNLATQTVR